jgi:hypothetical protein
MRSVAHDLGHLTLGQQRLCVVRDGGLDDFAADDGTVVRVQAQILTRGRPLQRA